MTAISRMEKLAKKLTNKRYRSGYVSAHVRMWLANQIRGLRKQRGWSQTEFAQHLGKPQSVVSRLEDPGYGKLTLQTLLDVASTFDVALSVRFVSFPDFIAKTNDLSPRAMEVESFEPTGIRADVSYLIRAREPVSSASIENISAPSAGFQALLAAAVPALDHRGRYVGH